MSNINLKRFVDINIQPHISSIINGSRDTTVLFTDEVPTSTSGLDPKDIGTIVFNSTTYNTVIVNSDNYKMVFSGNSKVLNYLNTYFNNGGIKVLVVCNIDIEDMVIRDTNDDITDDIISYLDNEYICISYLTDPNDPTDPEKDYTTQNYNLLKEFAKYRNEKSDIYGINEKIIIARTEDVTDTEKVKNFAVKYSTTKITETEVDYSVGAEMTMAAYLSQINVNETNSIYDYMFTEEKIKEENIEDSTYKTIINNNINVDINLSGTVRNCGGNCKDGYDLTNNYVKIILHQTLTESLLSLLTQKIKSTSGISKLYAVTAQELEKYLDCGYLTTDQVWTDADLKVTDDHGNSYTIIKKGDALLNGYLIKILPMSALSNADKLAHKAPPIYVVIADQYGIRVITVNGEII